MFIKLFMILGFIFLLFLLGITLILKRVKRFFTSIVPNINSDTQNYSNFGNQSSQPNATNSRNANLPNDEVVYKKDNIVIMKGDAKK